jgi:hypothetical protein
MSLVRCSAWTRTVSRLVSAKRMQWVIASGSVKFLLDLNSVRVFRITKFCRFGVGIFMAPRSSCRYKERALVLVAAVGAMVVVVWWLESGGNGE